MILRFQLLLGLFLTTAGAVAAETPRADGDVSLALIGGVELEPPANPSERSDMALDLSLVDGKWQDEAWGSALWFNRRNHVGKLVKSHVASGKTRLTVEMTIEDSPHAPGGEARYDLELERQGDTFTGTYRGRFLEAEVKGEVRGKVRPPVARPVAGFTPLKPGEHPRLIFRARDLPKLKQRMATPEGKAILQMLSNRAPLRDPSQVSDRHTAWMAANQAAIYQLTGEKAAADQAHRILMDQVVKRPMPIDRADMHHATRLLGVALTLDLCGEAFAKDIRELLTHYLYRAARDLYLCESDGTPLSSVATQPAGHRNAMRLACVGCAAIVLLDAPALSDAQHAEVRHWQRAAERDVLRYLRTGLTASGKGIEGDVYKALALSGGVLQFLHASKTALGRDLSDVHPLLLAGQILESPARASDPQVFDLSSISVQASGRWPMGFSSVPPKYLPLLKWCFDHSVGPQGKGHYDCAYPLQAAYALMNYPYEAEARRPPDALPLAVTDRERGRHVYRSAWQDETDVIVAVNFRSLTLPGVTGDKAEPAGFIRVATLGQTWLNARVGMPARNEDFGGKTLYTESPRPQQYLVGAQLDSMYLEDLARRPKPRPVRRKDGSVAPAQPDVELQKLHFREVAGEFVDAGVRCRRHLAIDFSGACGAPVLVAIVDQIEKGDLPAHWDFPLPGRGPKTSRNQFAWSDPDAPGPSLAGIVAVPAQIGGLRMPAGDMHFVVFTVQSDAAPPMKVEGKGADARVIAGGQTITFDGDRINLAK